MSVTPSIVSDFSNLTTSEIGEKAIQECKVILEATGTSAKLKRWAVDSLESSYQRRHSKTIHGTNRQIWGSAATGLIVSIGGGIAVGTSFACLPLGIIMGVFVGIAALASFAVTAHGIRRTYKDTKRVSGGNIDGGKFLKETLQNITSGAVQALISKEKIDTWKIEKEQHQEKKNLLQTLKNLPTQFRTTITLSEENLKDLFTEKINTENIFKTLQEHLRNNIQILEKNPNQLDNAKSLVKRTLERQLKFLKKMNPPVDTTKLEERIKEIDNYDLDQIKTALELCSKCYGKIEEAIAKQTIKQDLTTVINNSIPQNLREEIKQLHKNLEATTIALELINNKGTNKLNETIEKYNALDDTVQGAVKKIITQVKEKKQTIEDLSNQVDLLKETIKDKAQLRENALPTAEEFLEEEIQSLKQNALNKAKKEIKNQLKPELEILESIIKNQYKFNFEGSEENDAINEVNNKLNEELQTIKNIAQDYLNQIDKQLDKYFNIDTFDFNQKNNLENIQVSINKILTEAKNALKELPKKIEKQLRENVADIDIGDVMQSVKDFTKNQQITLTPYL